MPATPNISEVKRALRADLLRIEHVTGVGVAGDSLQVYLEIEDEETIRGARNLVESRAPGTPVEFVTTGPFRPTG